MNFLTKLDVFSFDAIVTWLNDGTIQMVRGEDREVLESVQESLNGSMITVINDEIVASLDGEIVLFDGELETVKVFDYTADCVHAVCIDGNKKYIATGHYEGRVCFYKQNSDDKPTVSKLVKPTTYISFIT